ncbi:MAG: pirin family protein [bacterium]|nr:pirin family protein [bacterium]
MSHTKTIAQIFTARPTLEGAGVHLHRGFANAEVPRFDPFLLFDDFSSPNPADYLSGFPMHPHRGMETVTYILDGDVRHRDSLGNAGVIGRGDVQWMTSGSGIIHEEMPEGIMGIQGFQLWVNLPKANKMMTPRYQEVKNKIIPEIALGTHAKARVIAGQVSGVTGPVADIMASPLYVDITLAAGQHLDFPVVAGYTTFAYVFNGAVGIAGQSRAEYGQGSIMLFSREGDTVSVGAGGAGARFLLVSGKPLDEPIAWHGPIVMNSDEELETAFQELRDGVFVK